ncbi:MAG: nicotinate (nicotinamide) nucleotide adenylyltransferase [Muribaculaceae bacterium]|nr:nicotinate (nicotinamide) nucleotide adenylyltransferase [Muribaculaceae bacterium]
MSGKRIGIYGGTFDPPHIGHLRVAQGALASGMVDEVWMMVSPRNPLKLENDISADSVRLEMCQLAVESIPNIRVSDFEFNLPVPSFTITTLETLKKEYPENTYLLIIGEDNFDNLGKWKEPERILSEFGIIIYPRPGSVPGNKRLPKGALMMNDVEQTDISSSELRRYFHNLSSAGDKDLSDADAGKDNPDLIIEEMVVPKVRGYIFRMGIYS